MKWRAISLTGTVSFAALYFFYPEICDKISLVLIILLGFAHGINDIFIINKALAKNNKLNIPYRIMYPAVIAVLFLLFVYAPFVTLCFFIGASAYHFGEQQFSGIAYHGNTVVKTGFLFFYGLFILSLLFYFHKGGFLQSVENLTDARLHEGLPLVMLFLSFLGLFAFAVFYALKSDINLKSEIFLLVIFMVVFKQLSLISAFTIYFILWHSIPSIITQVTFLYGSLSLKSFKSYFHKGMIYYVACLLVLILYQVFNVMDFQVSFVYFLASITIPHALTMLYMLNNSKSKTLKSINQ
ncbi:hypothetical protein CHU92_01290 [Flavobacterium cyanobacteriorum]|uniref:Beta-carotene 15,15'-dioxygenase n=1 Tax=Flavobacterium cyanobacteriorum TaxID=2022802 RepID=A0A256A197_9FLAO|nr:Brp/Blh family beta-carotene 15,15'-dioxygenase [Flavobacterium cyanobacteriorum]OYQ46830.1 hypothetical protein CHU92_01290 [Flavobacterium cyanobacteriorum]